MACQRLDKSSSTIPLYHFVSSVMLMFILPCNREGDKLVPSVQKKISELEVSLLHLQQNIDIPDIQLTIHPAISGVVQKAAEENRKPRVEDFGNQVSDSTFLNQLQKDVSRWIKEIKKVLKFCTLNVTCVCIQKLMPIHELCPLHVHITC